MAEPDNAEVTDATRAEEQIEAKKHGAPDRPPTPPPGGGGDRRQPARRSGGGGALRRKKQAGPRGEGRSPAPPGLSPRPATISPCREHGLIRVRGGWSLVGFGGLGVVAEPRVE